MLSKSESKLIKSLQFKKYRDAEGLFVTEGLKTSEELLKSDFKIKWIVTTSDFLSQHDAIKNKISQSQIKFVTEKELESLGRFSSNQTLLVIAETKTNLPIYINNELVIVLNQLRDPGNMGTIIRIADWYGIRKIICSTDCVDMYNSKVITSSMGSFTRVQMYYTELTSYFKLVSPSLPVIGTFLEGESIHTFNFPSHGFLVMGNESNGIESSIFPFITHRITIPRVGIAESLNVAISTGIVLDNWKRKYH